MLLNLRIITSIMISMISAITNLFYVSTICIVKCWRMVWTQSDTIYVDFRARALRIVVGDTVECQQICHDWWHNLNQTKTFQVHEEVRRGGQTNLSYSLFASVASTEYRFDRALLQFCDGEWTCLACERSEGCVHQRLWYSVQQNRGNMQAVYDRDFFALPEGKKLENMCLILF